VFTYVRWSVALHEPIRDLVAAIDPRAWRVGLPVSVAGIAALALSRGTARRPAVVGAGWWLAFLLPVLPLIHHTYLYYLYVPWAGGAVAVAALGRIAVERVRRPRGIALGVLAAAGFALAESRNVMIRETAVRDALPADRTIRDATLIRHALVSLHEAALPPGTRVVFVNPVPRRRFDLVTGAPTRSEDVPDRTPYMPLESAMRGGETLRLFMPGLVYGGFTTTIRPEHESAEAFHYEQRGWLRRWGRGQEALLRQAEVQRAAGQWAAADSTLRRARALENGAGRRPR
jgi:hypothetical protein